MNFLDSVQGCTLFFLIALLGFNDTLLEQVCKSTVSLSKVDNKVRLRWMLQDFAVKEADSTSCKVVVTKKWHSLHTQSYHWPCRLARFVEDRCALGQTFTHR